MKHTQLHRVDVVASPSIGRRHPPSVRRSVANSRRKEAKIKHNIGDKEQNLHDDAVTTAAAATTGGTTTTIHQTQHRTARAKATTTTTKTAMMMVWLVTVRRSWRSYDCWGRTSAVAAGGGGDVDDYLTFYFVSAETSFFSFHIDFGWLVVCALRTSSDVNRCFGVVLEFCKFWRVFRCNLSISVVISSEFVDF